MKWVHRLLGSLLVVVLTVVLFRVLMPALQGGTAWKDFLAKAGEHHLLVIAVCLGLILGLVLYVLTGLSARPRAAYLSYETKQGNISISLQALQEFIGHLRVEFPSVLALTPKVSARDEALDVVLQVKIKAGAPIPEVSRMLQERTRLMIQEKVGIQDIRDVEVKVEEIVREKEHPVHRVTSPGPPPAGDII